MSVTVADQETFVKQTAIVAAMGLWQGLTDEERQGYVQETRERLSAAEILENIITVIEFAGFDVTPREPELGMGGYL